MMTKPTKIALPHCMQMPGPMQKTLRFGQFTLNPETATLSGATGPLPLRPKAFDLLCYLARHPGRVVSKTEHIETVWRNIIVTDNALVQSIRDVRTALNDGGQEILKTVARRGYLFAAPVVEIEVPRAVLPPANRKTGALDLMPADLTQEIHYARAPDGVRIAWARVGQGPPLMRAANWLTHLEYDWENPLRVSGLINLAKNYTLIRYDPRGTGLSDWDVADLSLDAWVSDFETVRNGCRRSWVKTLPSAGRFARLCSVDILRGAAPGPHLASCSVGRLCARRQQALAAGKGEAHSDGDSHAHGMGC